MESEDQQQEQEEARKSRTAKRPVLTGGIRKPRASSAHNKRQQDFNNRPKTDTDRLIQALTYLTQQTDPPKISQ